MLKLTILLVCLVVYCVKAQYVPPEALVEPLKPAGIRLSIPHEDGITLVAYHVKFNEEFDGLEAGTIAKDILKQKNGRWTYQDKTTKLKEGDTIYYWVHVVYDRLGYNLVDQEHKVTSFFDINGQRVGVDNNTNSNSNYNQSCVLSSTKVYNTVGASRNVCAGELLFEEDFKDLRDLARLQNKKWTIVEQFAGAPDYEFVVYKNSPENVNILYGLKISPKLLTEPQNDKFIRDGNLTLTKCTGNLNTDECCKKASGWNILPPVSSGRINTKSFLNFEFGRVEIRAKLPRGDWIYPLLLLEPSGFFGDLPTTQIRVAAASGNSELTLFDGTDISGHVLWGGTVRADSQGYRSKTTKYNSELWSQKFHTYEMIWSPNRIVLKVDGEAYNDNYLDLPARTPCYLTLGVAVGGVLEFPDYVVSKDYAKTWRNIEAKAMYNFYRSTQTWYKTWHNDETSLEVDYVKVWAI